MSAVVLDREYADVLLGLAASEGLLEEKNRTFFEEKKKERPDLIDSLLAAIVAHKRIVLPMTELYGREIPIKGRLLDRVDISFLTQEEEDKLGSNDDILPLFSSQASLVDYLNACGMTVTTDSLTHAMSSRNDLIAEHLKRFGDSGPRLKLRDALAQAMGQKGPLSDEDRAFLASYGQVARLLNDATYHLHNLNDQIHRANALGADILLSKPLGARSSAGRDGGPIRRISELEATDMSTLDRTNLFQFLALNIGSLPYRSTLTESVALAKTSEAESLRQRTRQLFDELHAGRTTDLAQLKKEIDTARGFMAGAEPWSNISNISTVVGVPLGMLAFFSNNASTVGFGVGVIGAYALGRAWLGQAGANNWVKFGKGNV